MSRKQRFIQHLSESEIQALKQGHKSGRSHTYRCRCKAILLSHEKWTCRQLADLFEVNYMSITSWLNRWEAGGMDGLADKPGRGRKSILQADKSEHVKQVNQIVDKSPGNLKKALSEIEAELGVKMSKKTLQRFLKKLTEDGSASGNAPQANRIKLSSKES